MRSTKPGAPGFAQQRGQARLQRVPAVEEALRRARDRVAAAAGACLVGIDEHAALEQAREHRIVGDQQAARQQQLAVGIAHVPRQRRAAAQLGTNLQERDQFHVAIPAHGRGCTNDSPMAVRACLCGYRPLRAAA
jgi:hypothetical protein